MEDNQNIESIVPLASHIASLVRKLISIRAPNLILYHKIPNLDDEQKQILISTLLDLLPPGLEAKTKWDEVFIY